MKNIITLLLILSPLFLFSQSTEKILVCKEGKEVWLNKCLSEIDTTQNVRAIDYYTKECARTANTTFCEWKKIIIIKEDTIFCATTKKKKYIKICEE